eukprot:807826_1
MALNCIFVGDKLEHLIESLDSVSPLPAPYIDQYINGLHSLVPSELTHYKNTCYQTWTDAKKKQNIILPNTSHLLRYYQRALVGSNVLVYFINVNEQNNYAFEMLRIWKVKDRSKLHHGNPQHPHKSYLLCQAMMVGLSHFVPPPKYLCIVLCGAVSQKKFTDKQAFMIQTYSDIIFKKCQKSKESVLFIKDIPFHAHGGVPPNELHTKLMQRIKQFISNRTTQHKGDKQKQLLISVYGNQMIKTLKTSHIEFILFCSILFGSIKMNDRLVLFPMNIEVEIIDMRSIDGKPITFAHQNTKISVKIRVNNKAYRFGKKKWQLSKHFLLSK